MSTQVLNEVLSFTEQENSDPIMYFTEAINNLTKAQLVYGYKIDKYIKEKENHQLAVVAKLEEVGKKLERQEGAILKGSAHLDYIENRLIPEVAEYYGIPHNRVLHQHIKKYRRSLVRSHELNLDPIYNRLLRLYFIRDVREPEQEFEGEVCGRLGRTMGQIRMESQAIALYFDESCGYSTFREALVLNRDYMKVGKEVILSMEEKYGIFDTDRDRAVNLSQRLILEYDNVAGYSDKAYISWVNGMIKEYKKLCHQQKDGVMFVLSEGFERYCMYEGQSFACDLKSNYTHDMNRILSNNKLREMFVQFIASTFINVW